MKKLRLNRFSEHKATCGALSIGSEVICYTLELPWRDNKVGKSCIPVGTYRALHHYSEKFGETYWLQDVPGRTEIIFHAGNSIKDTRGCILLGEELHQNDTISHSRRAVEKFLKEMNGEKEIEITIEEAK